jgi:hypothetical protein
LQVVAAYYYYYYYYYYIHEKKIPFKIAKKEEERGHFGVSNRPPNLAKF